MKYIKLFESENIDRGKIFAYKLIRKLYSIDDYVIDKVVDVLYDMDAEDMDYDHHYLFGDGPYSQECTFIFEAFKYHIENFFGSDSLAKSRVISDIDVILEERQTDLLYINMKALKVEFVQSKYFNDEQHVNSFFDVTQFLEDVLLFIFEKYPSDIKEILVRLNKGDINERYHRVFENLLEYSDLDKSYKNAIKGTLKFGGQEEIDL